ncbi:MAG: methyltransferase domain-containing protein [Desulfobacteraceae bacterium]|jgi:ubiquinone/menaquinone biosynthesis C-methylase UbiE
MASIKVPIRKYWDWRSRSYGYDADISYGTAATWHTTLQKLLPPATGKRALDIGTGTGQIAFYLAHSGFAVTGIDLSEKMISHAKQHAAKQRLQIDFLSGDAEALNFESNTFDVVVSRNLIWTLPDPIKAIAEWRRVIKPNGKIVISDGDWRNTTRKQMYQLIVDIFRGLFKKTALTSLLFFLSYFHAQKQLPYYKGLQAVDVGNLLQSAGFKDISFYDTACFQLHPYRRDGSMVDNPNFFVVHAEK